MKKTLFKLTMVALLGIALSSCTKKTTSPTTPPSTTPSFTATVAGTATTFTGSANLGSNYLTIIGSNSTYTINIYVPTPVSTGTVTLAASSGAYATAQTGSGQFWETTSGSTGTLNISTYNTSTKIVSGSFSFTGAPITGSGNLSVTNGLFSNISF